MNALRFRLRVAEVVPESEDVVSVRVAGHRLDRLGGTAGAVFLRRSHTRGRWWEPHPFSLSEALVAQLPAADWRRRGVGDYSRDLGELPVGACGRRRAVRRVHERGQTAREKTLLIAGGIGITPIRALLDELDGDVVVLYRVLKREDAIFGDELERGAGPRRGRCGSSRPRR